MKKTISLFAIILTSILLGGCAAALVGGGAVGGYAVAKDKGTVGTYTDDSVITSKIKSKYVAEPGIRSLNISVSTNRGIVSLTGSVPNKKVWNRAVELARDTTGVKAVNTSNLTIRP